MRRMHVVVVFEFDGVDDINGDKADEIVQSLTQATDEWTESFFGGHTPLAVWLDDARMRECEEV